MRYYLKQETTKISKRVNGLRVSLYKYYIAHSTSFTVSLDTLSDMKIDDECGPHFFSLNDNETFHFISYVL